MANEAELLDPPVETAETSTPAAPEAPESLRDTLSKAFDESAGETAEPTAPKPASEPAAPAETKAKETEKAVGGAESGLGKPAEGLKDQKAPAGALKAPAQWKPAVKEKWNTLPREVQEEVLRREGDSMRLIGSVGHKIRLADEVAGHLQPFMEQLSNNGMTPSSFMGDIFTSVQTLARGNPQERAEVVANIVQSYGVDVRTLDAILTRRIQSGPEAADARRLAARATSVIQQREQEVRQQGESEAEKAIAVFAADPKHEFFSDVRELMGDLLDAGRAETLDDAYAAAVWAHPDTRKILLERQQQERVQSKSARVLAARRASSAIHGTPAGMAGAQLNPNASLRETLEAAFDEHETN